MTKPLNIDEILKAIDDQIGVHQEHFWKQVGRCVYCSDCNVKLYQGSIPKTHTKVVAKQRFGEPKETTEMRNRWGK